MPKEVMADKEEKLAGSSTSTDSLQIDMTKTSEENFFDKSGHQQLLEASNERRKILFCNDAPSIDEHNSLVVEPDPSPPLHVLSIRKHKYSDSFNLGITAPQKTERPSKKHRTEMEPPFEPAIQRNINKQWANARKTGEDKTRITAICNKVCSDIKNKYSENILHVWPAYDSTNKDNIQFVVTTKEDLDTLDLDFGYSTVVRRANTYSKEANVVMKHISDKKITLPLKDSERIESVINRRAEELLNNHRYLSAISGIGIRSRGFSNGKHEFIQEACIVLYVQTKGKIPLDETEFPKILDGIPVDVLEGEFQTCALPTQFQNNLCMGCQIQSERSNIPGTFGGFVEHPKYGLSAVTCAHVVLGDAEIPDLQRIGKTIWNSCTKPVYQPDSMDPNSNYFGQVKEVIFDTGGNGRPGVDLAVIQVEKRPPLIGNFPAANLYQRENMNFETGKVRFTLNENNNYVVKFGRTTEETNGFVQFSNTAVKLIDHTQRYQLPSGNYRYRLFNQYDIRASSRNFVDKGDSGSLVLKTDVSGDFVCIGMVVGHIFPSGNGVVTPISAILSELGVQCFKDFRLDKQSTIENRLSSIERKIDLIVSKLPQN